jgi:hypothetical protein
MIIPAIEQAMWQRWQQMRAEAQQLAHAPAPRQQTRAQTLLLLAEQGQTVTLPKAQTGYELITRCQGVATGLRFRCEQAITTLERQPDSLDGLQRMQGALSAIQDYEAFLLQLREQNWDQEWLDSIFGA